MKQTLNELLRTITEGYLKKIDMNNIPSPSTIEREILTASNLAILEYNLGEESPPGSGEYPHPKKGDDRYKKVKKLEPIQIAQILTSLHGACRIGIHGVSGNKDYDILALYQEEGVNKGIYVTSSDDFRFIARKYNYTLSSKDFTEIMMALRDIVPRRMKCRDKNLIAVNNGIYDYANKMLLDFDPELVFTSKSHVDFVDNATNPHITMPDGDTWDVETWMNSLSDDYEIVNILWQILGAIIRPNVSWNKSAWLYSESGNNGKGTLCALMRNICGEGTYASIPLADFGKEFMLEPLTRVSAIIVDENSVGTYIDQAANLKAVITNDVISINRKHKSPIIHQFHGFMVQCMNEFPKVKDRSDSFYRRQLFIPMEKRFEGCERKYIKTDYLERKEVLEYVLYKILKTTNYYDLDEPTICKKLLEEYKEFNDPIKQFFNEIEECTVWNLLPFTFIYDLYVKWTLRNNPSGKPLARNPFNREIKKLVENSKVFYIAPNNPVVRSSGRMEKPEPLIAEYDVRNWMNSNYTGNDINKICQPELKDAYRGIQRYNPITTK